MRHSKDIIADILNGSRVINLPDAIKEFSDSIDLIEVKGECLVIYVRDPLLRYVIRRREQALINEVEGIRCLKVLLSSG